MIFVTMSQFRSRQIELVASVHIEPATLTSRGVGRRVVVVSPEFYDRALEDKIEVEDAAAARQDGDSIRHRDLMAEVGV